MNLSLEISQLTSKSKIRLVIRNGGRNILKCANRELRIIVTGNKFMTSQHLLLSQITSIQAQQNVILSPFII